MVNRIFNPRVGIAKNQIGNFEQYELIAKEGHWKYASDIAAGFAKKWFEDHPATDPVLKAKSLAPQFSFVVYNGAILG